MATHPTGSPIVGMAALSLLESLLISMREHDLLSEKQVADLKDDVVAAHRYAATKGDKVLHDAVADLVAGVNGPRNGTYALRKSKGR